MRMHPKTTETSIPVTSYSKLLKQRARSKHYRFDCLRHKNAEREQYHMHLHISSLHLLAAINPICSLEKSSRSIRMDYSLIVSSRPVSRRIRSPTAVSVPVWIKIPLILVSSPKDLHITEFRIIYLKIYESGCFSSPKSNTTAVSDQIRRNITWALLNSWCAMEQLICICSRFMFMHGSLCVYGAKIFLKIYWCVSGGQCIFTLLFSLCIDFHIAAIYYSWCSI